jgi:hypothetical protein
MSPTPIAPVLDDDGRPIDHSRFIKDFAQWAPILSAVLAADRAKLDDAVGKLVADGQGDELFHMLDAFHDLAVRSTAVAKLLEGAEARLMLVAHEMGEARRHD